MPAHFEKAYSRLSYAILLTLIATRAHGDDTHYNNLLIGDRASGMGGAYTAISDDPSGLYYNPAGIVYAGSRNFTASVNAYHTTEVRYKSVVGGQDWVRRSSSLLPNFFGVTQPMLGGMVGFSYAVTDSMVEDQDFTIHNPNPSVSQFTIDLNARDTTTKVGPSYAKEISDSLSIGVTLYAHFREAKTINNQWVTYSTGSDFWVNNYMDTSEFGVEPVLGVMWSPMDKMSVGFSARKVSIINSSWEIQNTYVNEAAVAPNPVFNPPVLIEGNDKRELPLVSALGIGYFPSSKLLLSADFKHYSATNASGPFPAREATWNVACGAEYFPNGSLAVRGGFFTNRSNTPQVSRSKAGQEDHYDMAGFSASLTKMTPTSSITGGVTYSWGSGDSQPYGDYTIKTVNAHSMTVFLSSSYSY